MNTSSTHRPLHPMIWVAAVSVTLLSIAGIAAITGLIPTSKSAESPAIPQPVASIAAPAPVAVTPPAETPAPAQKLAVKPNPPVKHRRTEHRTEQIARTETIPQPAPHVALPQPPQPPAVCNDCGRIESIQRIAHEGDGSGVGAVAGGVLGGALGNSVGQGNGRTLATIAGVIGGAVIGNRVEKSQKQSITYQTTVRFDDGTSRVFNSDHEQGFYEGERVRLVNGAIKPE